MVVFICNKCGESLKKQVVGAHASRCKGINVSCMDCQKDFTATTYNEHTSCISEAEKYSAKGFVPKVQKGAKKQESWVEMVRSIAQKHKNMSAGVRSVFNFIERTDNIPRKQKGFLNFFQNSCRLVSRQDVEAAWALIEKEMKAEKENGANGAQNGTDAAKQNGTAAAAGAGAVQNGKPQKRKPTEEVVESGEPEQKKQKKKKAKKEKAQNGNEVEVPAENGTADGETTKNGTPQKRKAEAVESSEPTEQSKKKKKKGKKDKNQEVEVPTENGTSADGDNAPAEEAEPTEQKKQKKKKAKKEKAQNGNVVEAEEEKEVAPPVTKQKKQKTPIAVENVQTSQESQPAAKQKKQKKSKV
ncbi:AGAP006469-PA [Anopheles gambiae str. PEST]|uniref:AGAP006469-PA n=1 Tax=Anopheles gambiae TaxID=7165 RepID=A0NET6_ANOGA|nr:AGAP006469-PA [Anopheles gambiae str. PEST]